MGSWKIEQPERLSIDEEVKRLEVYLLHGRLNVVGTDGPARVEVSAIANRPLTVRLSGGTLSVANENIPKWPGLLWWIFGRRFRVDVSIAVPREATATLNVVSGSAVVSALRAGADVDMTSGRITLLGLGGPVRAKVISGSIEALSIGGRVELETVSGEITVADATAQEVRVRTISGSITCDLDNPPSNGEIRLETTSGEITARVREDSDLRVRLHAISGRVTCAFPELNAGGAKSVSGVLGAGTGQLTANATSGNIALLRRPVEYDEVDPREGE
jgi:DUF4097 and DUF4098 domain-containing protein YvlB